MCKINVVNVTKMIRLCLRSYSLRSSSVVPKPIFAYIAIQLPLYLCEFCVLFFVHSRCRLHFFAAMSAFDFILIARGLYGIGSAEDDFFSYSQFIHCRV